MPTPIEIKAAKLFTAIQARIKKLKTGEQMQLAVATDFTRLPAAVQAVFVDALTEVEKGG